MKTLSAVISVCVLGAACLQAAPLPFEEAKVAQVVNEVSILDRESLTETPAQVDARFAAPNLLQTGRRSRAQLEAEDGTVFRVGSNTVFSFEAAQRQVNLQQGSLLFNSPEGAGGGRIVTASASASVLGTTIVVVATPDGGFKVLCLEGVARIEFPDGSSQTLEAGQMSFVMPSQDVQLPGSAGGGTVPAGEPGPKLTFDLARMTGGSALLNGFRAPLPSILKVQQARDGQSARISDGGLRQTGVRIVNARSHDRLNIIHASSRMPTIHNVGRLQRLARIGELRYGSDLRSLYRAVQNGNTSLLSSLLSYHHYHDDYYCDDHYYYNYSGSSNFIVGGDVGDE